MLVWINNPVVFKISLYILTNKLSNCVDSSCEAFCQTSHLSFSKYCIAPSIITQCLKYSGYLWRKVLRKPIIISWQSVFTIFVEQKSDPWKIRDWLCNKNTSTSNFFLVMQSNCYIKTYLNQFQNLNEETLTIKKKLEGRPSFCAKIIWQMYMYAYAGIFFADLVSGKIHKRFPRWRAGVNDLPTMFKVYVNVDGRSIKLSLTFNPRLSACVKVYPESDGWCRSAKVSRSRRENCIIAYI